MKVASNSYRTYGVSFKNVYLDNNRVLTAKKVDRYVNRIAREAKLTEIKESVIKFVKRIFNK